MTLIDPTFDENRRSEEGNSTPSWNPEVPTGAQVARHSKQCNQTIAATEPAIIDNAESGSTKPRKYLKKVLCWAVLAFMVVGTIVSVCVAVFGVNPIEYFVPVDPPGLTEAIRWDAENGLSIIVENACDDTWTKEFDHAIAEWNKTDALLLRPRRTAHDPDCGEYIGRLRVCNSDYGRTNWKGLNLVFMRDDHIVHSVSKLNDYWLTTETARQYTMCHELGHGCKSTIVTNLL